jgi:hypothetical protein
MIATGPPKRILEDRANSVPDGIVGPEPINVADGRVDVSRDPSSPSR